MRYPQPVHVSGLHMKAITAREVGDTFMAGLDGRETPGMNVVRLPGDASNRSYYRVSADGGTYHARGSVIVGAQTASWRQ